MTIGVRFSAPVTPEGGGLTYETVCADQICRPKGGSRRQRSFRRSCERLDALVLDRLTNVDVCGRIFTVKDQGHAGAQSQRGKYDGKIVCDAVDLEAVESQYREALNGRYRYTYSCRLHSKPGEVSQ